MTSLSGDRFTAAQTVLWSTDFCFFSRRGRGNTQKGLEAGRDKFDWQAADNMVYRSLNPCLLDQPSLQSRLFTIYCNLQIVTYFDQGREIRRH